MVHWRDQLPPGNPVFRRGTEEAGGEHAVQSNSTTIAARDGDRWFWLYRWTDWQQIEKSQEGLSGPKARPRTEWRFGFMKQARKRLSHDANDDAMTQHQPGSERCEQSGSWTEEPVPNQESSSTELEREKPWCERGNSNCVWRKTHLHAMRNPEYGSVIWSLVLINSSLKVLWL